MNIYAVFGSGGCGRGIMPLLRDQVSQRDCELVFIDDFSSRPEVNGHAVRTFEYLRTTPASSKLVALAIANPRIRHDLDVRCQDNGLELMGIVAKSCVIMDDVDLGVGALLSPFVTITSNVRIGRCFHANLYSQVEHDCVVGDYVTFAPGVRCNGSVIIGDHAYIGSGAIIKQGVTIGAGATVGMGAVVIRDVPVNATVVGNPAKSISAGQSSS